MSFNEMHATAGATPAGRCFTRLPWRPGLCVAETSADQPEEKPPKMLVSWTTCCGGLRQAVRPGLASGSSLSTLLSPTTPVHSDMVFSPMVETPSRSVARKVEHTEAPWPTVSSQGMRIRLIRPRPLTSLPVWRSNSTGRPSCNKLQLALPMVKAFSIFSVTHEEKKLQPLGLHHCHSHQMPSISNDQESSR